MERAQFIAEALESRMLQQSSEGTTYLMVPSMLTDAVLTFVNNGEGILYERDVDLGE